MIGADGKVARRGSGFIVGAEGKIITNYHVIAHSKAGSVKLANGDIYEIRHVFEIDKRRDLAIIAIRAVDLSVLAPGRRLNTLKNGLPIVTPSQSTGRRRRDVPYFDR